MTTIQIANIELPAPGKKQATITDASGETWKIWPNNLVGIDVGKNYSVEFTTSEFKGKEYKLITKAYPAEPDPVITRNGNGATVQTSPPNELHFVTTLLAAFIISGGIKPGDKKTLWETVKDLRGCYAATFGAQNQESRH